MAQPPSYGKAATASTSRATKPFPPKKRKAPPVQQPPLPQQQQMPPDNAAIAQAILQRKAGGY